MDLHVYILSNANGLAISHLARNTMDKFEIAYQEKSFVNITDFDKLKDAFSQIKNVDGSKIIFNSLDDPDHNKHLKEFSSNEGILTIDFTSYSLNRISKYLGVSPVGGDLEDDYKVIHHYKRLDALDFAIKYDDGQDFKGLEYCDICIVGVSRSSKTPLSVYLASIGYKVSNVPLLLESRVPQELFEIDSRKIFGLTMDKYRLQKIREERLNSIKLPKSSKYSDLGHIEAELDHAYEIMKDLDCKIIDVTNKSIEETSEYIISNIEKINR